MYDLCCIGHITKDKIVVNNNTKYSAGGTAFYFSHAIKIFNDINYYITTIVGKSEINSIKNLRKIGIKANSIICENSVFFENIYNTNTDERKQCVLSKAIPFSPSIVKNIESRYIHFGPLLNDDFSTESIINKSKESLISLDVQGFLRSLDNKHNVIPVNWKSKEAVLKCVYFLKANEYELMTLTKTKDILEGIKIINKWGVKEIIITLGHMGSLIFDGAILYKIPAYKPRTIIDVTGCGDTYMAGYLYCRFKNKNIEDSGNFGAAMATLKIENYGPFNSTYPDILECINSFDKIYPNNN